MERLTVVGAGLTGLIAAIEAAELGWPVDLFESSAHPGGRANTLSGQFRANLGPHAVYVDGSLWRWLGQRRLQPLVVAAMPASTLFRFGGRLGSLSPEMRSAAGKLPAVAPSDISFRDWLLRYMDLGCAEGFIGLLYVTAYDYDPGRLSAAFMNERLRRTLSDTARYVVGGWGRMVAGLSQYAQELGVRLRTECRVFALRPTPTIVATTLADARKLTADPGLCWPSATAGLLDVGLRADPTIDWFRVLDLDARIYLARYSAVDDSLAPPGRDLVQAASACQPGEAFEAALSRVEGVMDACWPGWRNRVEWRRHALMRSRTGAIDLPGNDWRDRPAVIRGPMLCVATDQSAGAGMLAEVGAAAAVEAVRALSA